MKTTTRKVLEQIFTERRRQINKEGWSTVHDDLDHEEGTLAAAAACYAGRAFGKRKSRPPAGWPWSDEWWKPKTPRRDLIRAGALIVAEIEKLDRAAKIEAEEKETYR